MAAQINIYPSKVPTMPSSAQSSRKGSDSVSGRIYAMDKEMILRERRAAVTETFFYIMCDIPVIRENIFKRLDLKTVVELAWVDPRLMEPVRDYLIERKAFYGGFSIAYGDLNLRAVEGVDMELQAHNRRAIALRNRMFVDPSLAPTHQYIVAEIRYAIFHYVCGRLPVEGSESDKTLLGQIFPSAQALGAALVIEGRLISLLVQELFPKTDPASLKANAAEIVRCCRFLAAIIEHFIRQAGALDAVWAGATPEGHATTKEEIAQRIRAMNLAFDAADLSVVAKARLCCYLLQVASQEEPEHLATAFGEGLGYLLEKRGGMLSKKVYSCKIKRTVTINLTGRPRSLSV